MQRAGKGRARIHTGESTTINIETDTLHTFPSALLQIALAPSYLSQSANHD
jgi:hypothetical protein